MVTAGSVALNHDSSGEKDPDTFSQPGVYQIGEV